jgi:predicted rRNA methylase YqxC with S4 and FtsJ domains
MEAVAQRLGRVVQQRLASSYSHAKREIEVGHVFVNDAVVMKAGALVHLTDRVEHRPDAPRRRRPPAGGRTQQRPRRRRPS